MFFIFIMDWLRIWYKCIVFPVITTPYFYELSLVWFIGMLVTNYIFFYMVDSDRIRYVFKTIVYQLFKTMLIGLLAATLLAALYDMVVFFTVTSDFFKAQQPIFLRLGLFGVPGGCCSPTLHGQCWQVVQQVMTIFFLGSTTLLAQYFISDVTYHLQDSKKWWLYLGSSSFVFVMCYLLFWFLGYI